MSRLETGLRLASIAVNVGAYFTHDMWCGLALVSLGTALYAVAVIVRIRHYGY